MFRCEQIMGQALEEYNKALVPIRELLDQSAIVPQFGERISKLAEEATSASSTTLLGWGTTQT